MKTETTTAIGPVQLIAVGFDPEAKFEGKIIKELEKLDKEKTIRLLDLLFIKKDETSNELVALSIENEELGAIIGALMGFEFDEKDLERIKKASSEDHHAFGLSTEQIAQLGQSLEPGMAAGVLLIEHVWARDLKKFIREAGGVPIAEGFLTPEAIATVAVEMQALTEAMEELEKEETDTTTQAAFA